MNINVYYNPKENVYIGIGSFPSQGNGVYVAVLEYSNSNRDFQLDNSADDIDLRVMGRDIVRIGNNEKRMTDFELFKMAKDNFIADDLYMMSTVDFVSIGSCNEDTLRNFIEANYEDRLGLTHFADAQSEHKTLTINESWEPRCSPEELDAKALAIYNQELGFREATIAFYKEFNVGELYELYKLCQITPENPFGRSYDDELFDAIGSVVDDKGKYLTDIFYDKIMDEKYTQPAMVLVNECKEAFANGDMALAYDKWCKVHDLTWPDGIANANKDFQNKMFEIHSHCMENFTNEEVYAISDYGKHHSYSLADQITSAQDEKQEPETNNAKVQQQEL